MEVIREKMILLFEKNFGTVESFEFLSAHASSRIYARIVGHKTCIATYGDDKKENKCFVLFGEHLKKTKVQVPEIYTYEDDYSYYLQEDVGNQDLLSIISICDQEEKVRLLKMVVDILIPFQYQGHKNWNYENCFGFNLFDKNEIVRNFETYKKKFLDNLGVVYDNSVLAEEVEHLIRLVDTIPIESYRLMHRDFQARNIMVNDHNKLYIIDFQGSRLGPIEYDIATILFQSKGGYSRETRENIMQYYFDNNALIETNFEVFKKNVYIMALVRLFQALGSYGIAGLEEKKEYFITSIPTTAKSVIDLLKNIQEEYEYTFPYFHDLQIKTVDRFNAINEYE